MADALHALQSAETADYPQRIEIAHVPARARRVRIYQVTLPAEILLEPEATPMCYGCGEEPISRSGPFPHPHPHWRFLGECCRDLYWRFATSALWATRRSGLWRTEVDVLNYVFARIILLPIPDTSSRAQEGMN